MVLGGLLTLGAACPPSLTCRPARARENPLCDLGGGEPPADTCDGATATGDGAVAGSNPRQSNTGDSTCTGKVAGGIIGRYLLL